MKSRRALVAWIACAATATLGAARLGLAIADPESSSSAGGPLVPGGGIPMAACEATVLLLLGVIGAVVTARHPRNAIGWILCVIPLSLGLLILASHVYWSLALEHPAGSRAAELVAWLSGWIWIPAMVSALTLFPLLFPTGRPLTRRWRWVAWVAIGSCPVAANAVQGVRLVPKPDSDQPPSPNSNQSTSIFSRAVVSYSTAP